MGNIVTSGSAKVKPTSSPRSANYLELDGILCGALKSAHGGEATSDVVNEKIGADHIIRKHIAGVKYADIAMDVGFDMDKAFYAWLEATLNHDYMHKNGSVVGADGDGKETCRLDFHNGLITEIGFPEFDASSRDAGFLNVKFAPEYTRGTTKVGSSKGALAPYPKRIYRRQNYKLVIDKLDCTRVSKIDAITLKQKIAENPTGDLRASLGEPGHIEVPDLVITFQNLDGEQSWGDWYKSFVIEGSNGTNQEKAGTLTLLTEDLREELCTLTFYGLGIYSYNAPEYSAGIDPGDTDGRVKAKLYCEDVKLHFGK